MKTTIIPKSKWLHFGFSAHFICGRWCRFHMATQVGPWLISTVGLYVPNYKTGGSERGESDWLMANPNGEEIGCGRFYETMVFHAGKACDAPECGCGMPEVDGSDIDFRGYLTPREATIGHRDMCAKWAGISKIEDKLL